MKRFSKFFAILGLVFLLAACSNQGGKQENKEYKIGVVTDRAREIWEFALEDLEDEDFQVEVVLLNDFVQPNVSLAEGELDANAYQYIPFLYDFNESHETDLRSMGYTSAEQLAIWGGEGVEDLDNLPQGAQVAVINDPVNFGNALRVLEEVGLIEIADEAPLFPTDQDIVNVKNGLEIIEMEAPQVARALEDVDLIVSGTTMAVEAGLRREDALYLQDMDQASPYTKLNFVVRKEDLDNPDLKKILDSYQRQEVVDFANDTGDGTFFPAWPKANPVEEDYQNYHDYVEANPPE